MRALRRAVLTLLALTTVLSPALTAPVTAAGSTPPAVALPIPAPPGASAEPAAGDSAPSGARDGLAVGDVERPFARVAVPAQSPQAAAGLEQAAAATRRYFGSGPWSAIATTATDAAKCSGLNTYELRAMMVAPIFKESSGGTTASSAPAPMTLSRYDEWTGGRDGNTNANANYGLYAFRDPNTVYKRAYWHPGIGIWQYDTAGVGAPFTAIERMDVSVVGRDVAAGMRDRWCNPGGYLDHGAPYTETERRAAAWAPWWYTDNGGCPLCEDAYQEMAPNAATRFDNISTVPMSAAGGAIRRTCNLAGRTTAVTCWYIDPRQAQGASWWADLAPLDGGSPTQAPAPISEPFYVIKEGGYERRYWLTADTGYGRDITGLRLLGKNDRPKDAQSGSGIAWAPGAGLCDITVGRGSCSQLFLPPGITSTPATVGGTYRTVVLDVNDDRRDDVLWYRPGTGLDRLWLGQGKGKFVSRKISISGTYSVLAGDLSGNGTDDLVLYDAASGELHLWRFSAATAAPVRTTLRVQAHRVPFLVDLDGDGAKELFLHGPGALPDRIVRWQSGRFVSETVRINGSYRPFVGDFDGNGRDDIFWYSSTGADSIWFHSGSDRIIVHGSILGAYHPRVGDFDGNGRDDIVLKYLDRPGGVVLFADARGTFVRSVFGGDAGVTPVVADLGKDGRDDLLLVGPGGRKDHWLRWSSTRGKATVGLTLTGTQKALPGRFSGGGADGIFFYGAGSARDWVWWR